MNSRLKGFGWSLFALVLIYGATAHLPAGAQVAGGTISGTVVDSSGRVIPGAQISIMNVDTGVSRSAATNEEGLYTAPNLLPGSYELKFSAPGFKTEVRSGIVLTVGAAAVLDLTMQVGTAIETLQVTGEVPDVQLASSDISAVVNATTVRELPLNGRSWTDLAELQPGVNAIQTQPTFAAGTTCQKEGIAGMRTALQYPAHMIGGGFQIERAILPEDRREWHYHSPPPPLGIAWCDHRPPSFTRHDLHRDHAPLPVRPTRSRGRCALPI